jgi:ABC-type phosphate/phosphonate transport system substrate-binding protein
LLLVLSALGGAANSRAIAAADAVHKAAAEQIPTPTALTPFRMGFSMNIFTDVNVNDARASIKVWAQTVARERGIAADPDTALYRSFEEIAHALATSSVDLVAVTTTEYWKLRDTIDFDPIFVPVQRRYEASEFVVLAHRDSAIHTLSDLGGSNMLVFAGPQMELGETWLDTTLLRKGFPSASEFAARFVRVPRLSGAVLPVFFRKADACLVDRLSFDVIAELNPQISKQLVVIEASPPLVSAVVAMRRDCAPAIKSKLISALGKLQESAAGQQLMTIFQMDRLQLAPASALQPACDLLDEHQRLVLAQSNTTAEPAEKEVVR